MGKRKSVFLWIIVVVLSSNVKGSESEEEVKCNPPWELLHRSCVQFVKDKPFSTWQDARHYCAGRNGELLSINDKAEKDSVRPLLKKYLKGTHFLYWWIGLQLSSNGTWYWVDREELNKYLVEWAPQSGKTEDKYGQVLKNRCGMLDYQGYLKDEDCSVTKPFICEQIKLFPPIVSTTPTTTTTSEARTTTSVLTTTSQTKSTTTSQAKSTTTAEFITTPSKKPWTPATTERMMLTSTKAPDSSASPSHPPDVYDTKLVLDTTGLGSVQVEMLEYKIQYLKGKLEQQRLEKQLTKLKLRLLETMARVWSQLTAEQLLDVVSDTLDLV